MHASWHAVIEQTVQAPITRTYLPSGVDQFFGDLGKILSTMLAAAVVVGFFGRPLLDRLWVWQMKRNRVELKGELDDIYKERIAKIDAAVIEVGNLDERFEMLFDSRKAQGERLIAAARTSAEAHAEVLAGISKTMDKLADGNAKNAENISHIYGVLERRQPNRPRGTDDV